MRNRSAPDWGCRFDFLKKLWYNKKKDFFTDRSQSFTSFGGAYADLICNRSAPGRVIAGKTQLEGTCWKHMRIFIWGWKDRKIGLSRWCAGRSTFA
jgi:hypothetical protein